MVSSSLDGEQRRASLRSELQRIGAVTLVTASEQLGVSEMTIRRDLGYLEEEGIARRVRGGAVAVRAERFDLRQRKAARAKARIAQKLLPLVPSHGAVVMDASSTVYRLAGEVTASGLNVVTCGLETFRILSGKPGIRAFLTGGELEAETGSFVGVFARRLVEHFSYSRAFLSPTCLDAEFGASEATLEGAEVKEGMRVAASSVILAVDSTKLGLRAMARGLSLDQIDVLATELDPGDPRLDEFRNRVELL